MDLFGLDLATDVAVVAEIGVNHEGNIDVAAGLVEAVAKSGAHAVKFQSYTPERFVAATDADRLDRVTRFALDETEHRRLADVARDNGIAFFSSAITEDWVPLIAELGAAVKIASGDLTFEPVIRASARTDRPVILSTGAGTVDEIDQAVAWFRDEAGTGALADRLALLHCISAYPTPIEEANLLSIPFLAERFDLTVGWSNHVMGSEACLAAAALGASIIEVHVTDRKNGREFRDHALSFEPNELAELVMAVQRVRSSLGERGKAPGPSETPIRSAIRKGVVLAHGLQAGSILEEQDLMYARPAGDFPAHSAATLVGRRLRRDMVRGEPLATDALEGI